ncbi:alpha/beta hydrolase [Streptomyces sp. NPDC021749]|uniref:alpha/beta hydrolase n=1 Tax=Streptomyces sp. NPDC021749 TaxID=3154905 RepID=UPI0033BFD9DC
MAAIVLVPGFWTRSMGMGRSDSGTETAGHDVYPLTLTGLADRAAEATPDVDIYTHVDDIVRLIDDNGAGCGAGRTQWSEPAGYRRRGPDPGAHSTDRVCGRRTVAWRHGRDRLQQAQTQQEWRKQVAEKGDGWQLPAPPFEPAADPDHLAGLTTEQLARMAKLATPQPFATATRALNRPTVPPDTRCSVIASTLTPEQVRMLADSGNPVFKSMADADLPHLPTGHWPMFSQPIELASLLDEITR